MTESLFDLGASTARLDAIGAVWREVSAALVAVSTRVTSSSERLLDVWEGLGAMSYDRHRAELTDSLDLGAALAADAASIVERASGVVSAAQETLDGWRVALSRLPVREQADGSLLVQISTVAQQAQIRAATTAAGMLRARVDAHLRSADQRLRSIAIRWWAVTDRWRSILSGTELNFTTPVEQKTSGLLVVDGKAVFSLGGGTEGDSALPSYLIGPDQRTGRRVISKDDGQVRYEVPADTELVVRTGEGPATRISSRDGHPVTLIGDRWDNVLEGGDGSDRIIGNGGVDRLESGGGDDLVSGGSGIDYLHGGDGDDQMEGGHDGDNIYGGAGDDDLGGGSGLDDLNGGLGDDSVRGGGGNDVTAGGRGFDRLLGGSGDDAGYGGIGKDLIDGGPGREDDAFDDGGIFTSDTENVHLVSPVAGLEYSKLRIDGRPDFVERITDDLDNLGSSPAGKKLLEHVSRLKDQGVDITIREDEYGGSRHQWNSLKEHDVYINLATPPLAGDPLSPTETIFHETTHAIRMALGLDPEVAVEYTGVDDIDSGRSPDVDNSFDPTPGVEEAERDAVGLPVDHDDDPATPEQLRGDLDVYENLYREERNRPRREHYQTPY
ncbi:MAG: M91 family zinc metallopeptidase [Dermatophilaceae bacterium]